MAKQLTAAQVAALSKPGAYKIETGLYLRIVGASRTYSFRYSRHGKEHWRSIGPTHSITLSEAKAKAAQFRSDVLNGRELGKPIKAPDFGELVSKSLPMLTADLAASGQREWQVSCGIAAKHFGKKPVNEIEVQDVCDLLAPIWSARPIKADKLRSRIARIFDSAIAKKLRTDNPAAIKLVSTELGRLKRPAHVHHLSLYWEEAPALWQALKPRKGQAATALKLAILTGVRIGEVLKAEIGEFDFAANEWTIPLAHMKMRRTHIVPLSKQAVELITAWQETPFLAFGQHRLFVKLWHQEIIATLRETANDDYLTVHGLRGTLSTWLDQYAHVPMLVREFILAHTPKDAVAESYQETHQAPERRLLEDRRKALQRWGNYLEGIEEPQERQGPKVRRSTRI
jgi:integrase